MRQKSCVGMISFLIISLVFSGCMNRPGNEVYDIDVNGIPKFVDTDYTDLEKISEISRFRSAVGHDYSDTFESCRSMKHYYAPFDEFRGNGLVEVYSPVDGVISEIHDESFGPLEGDVNYQIRIKSDEYPAFSFIIFHVDLISDSITKGLQVDAGDLLGHAHINSPSLDHLGKSFDIAVQVGTPNGRRYISFFETMTDSLFNEYELRGASSREDFIISKEERDRNPITCDGEWFTIHEDDDPLVNWIELL